MKSKKLNFKELVNIKELNFYSIGRVNKSYKEDLILKYNFNDKNIKNIHFKFYYLNNMLTSEQKERLLKQYNNIDFYISCNEYARENKASVLLLCNYTLKKGV